MGTKMDCQQVRCISILTKRGSGQETQTLQTDKVFLETGEITRRVWDENASRFFTTEVFFTTEGTEDTEV